MKATLSVLAVALCLVVSFGAAADSPAAGTLAVEAAAAPASGLQAVEAAAATEAGACDALAQSLGAQGDDPTLAAYNPNCPPKRCNTNADCSQLGGQCGAPYCGGYCFTYDAPLCSYKKGCICYECP